MDGGRGAVAAATWPKTSELVRKLSGDLMPDPDQRRSQRRLAFIVVNGRDDALQELLGAAAEIDRQGASNRGEPSIPSRVSGLQPERPAGFILLVLDRDGQIGRCLAARRRQRRRRARLGRLERGEARSIVDHRDLASGHAHDLALDRVRGADLAAAHGLSVAVARRCTTAVGYGSSAVTSRSIRHGSGPGSIGSKPSASSWIVKVYAPWLQAGRTIGAASTSASGSAASPTSRSNGVTATTASGASR